MSPQPPSGRRPAGAGAQARAEAGAQRRRLGAEAEARALRWLQSRGAQLVEQNFVARRGEIDLIMRDGPYLAFIEVRFRSELALVGAAASVDRAKRKAIAQAAEAWLLLHPEATRLPCRFDVLALGEAESQIDWIKNAFDSSGW